MPNGWRPTTADGLLSHLLRETRIQGRNGATRIEPLLQDVVDASQASDNIPPGDILDLMDPEDIPIFDPGSLPTDIDSSSDPTNVVPNSSFEVGDGSGEPVNWNAIWDAGQEPDNPLRWESDPAQAHSGVGRAVLTFTTGWVDNVGIYSAAPMAVVSGARYLASAYVKSTVTGTHDAIVALITGPAPESTELFAPGAAYMEIGTVNNPGTAYINIAAEVVIPPGHRYAKYLLRGNGSTTTQTGEMSYDDVTLSQLTEGTIPGGVPWYAHPRDGHFDPKNSLYNVTQTSMYPGRLRLAASKAGRDTNVLCVGDSVTAGFGGPGVKSWVYMLMKELERAGCIIKSEGPTFVGVGDSLNNYTPDPRWTYSGTVTVGPWSVWASITNGSWAQFASTRVGTILKINYFHTGGNFAWSVDGGVVGASVTTNGSSTMGTVTVSGLTNTTHTIRVTGSSATPAEIVSVDFEAAVSGLRVYGAGVTQITTSQLIDTSFKSALTTGIAVGTPDIILICIGINDAAGSLDPMTYEDWVREIVRHSKKQGASVGVIVPPHTADYDMGHWAQYVTALYNVADKEDVALLDLTDIWGHYSTSSASGLFHDTVHPSPNGHAAFAHSVRQLVL